MERDTRKSLPRWLFAVLASAGLVASGIYIGIMSIEGFAGVRLVEAAGFGVFGVLMLWGALAR